MGRILIPGGGVSGPDSSELSATSGDVISGKSYVGADTDGEIGEGTLALSGNAVAADVVQGKTFYNTNPKQKLTGAKPTMASQTVIPALTQQTVQTNGNAMTGDIIVSPIPNQRGQYQYASGMGSGSNYYAFNAIPEGYYVKNGTSWAPEIRLETSKVRSYLGITAGKILKGQTIGGVAGTAQEYKQYVGRGLQGSTTTKKFTDMDGNSYNLYYLDLNLGFYPMSVTGISSANSNGDRVGAYGNDSYHIFYIYGTRESQMKWFNYDDASGIMWSTTHIYLPIPNRSYTWDILIDGHT